MYALQRIVTTAYNSAVKPLLLPAPVRYVVTLAVLAGVTILYKYILHVGVTTVALTFLVVVLLASAYWGVRLAVVLAITAAGAFNFFFLPPYGTFAVADPQNWVELFAFLITALVASNLSERARREARERERAVEELAKTEALQENERLRSALLESLTHEFRTPLTGIKAGVTSLLSGYELEESESRELLTVINEETDRLNRMVGEAAEMAQLDARMFKLDLHPLDMEDVIDSALADPRVARQRARFKRTPVDQLPPVTVDFERMREALIHLMENAEKYSTPGSPIRISTELKGDSVVTSIADQGEGIELEERNLIFDKFYRGRSQRYKARGTGMGLAIVKAIVEAHEGSVTVDSEAGKGSVFSISLPAAVKSSM